MIKTPETPKRKRLRQYQKLSIIGVIVALSAAFLSFLFLQYLLVPMKIDSSGYQVVSLTSGQVYFGKLKNIGGEYLYLEAPYVEQQVQAQEKNTDGSTKAAQTALIRVKDQVYGPQDMIAIKSDQVVFWQNLRDDSKVSQAIKAKAN